MQQIERLPKTKKTATSAVFLSANYSWWSIKDVKITFGEDLVHDTKDIRTLLDESQND